MSVNGKPELNIHRWVDIEHDKIQIQSQTLSRDPFRYVVIHKPAGVVTTTADERGGRTVFEVLGDQGKGLKPVGRLDKETTGLLLFTNDHQLANRVTSPESGLPKTYVAELDRPIRGSDLRTLSGGVEIELEGKIFRTKPATVSVRTASEIEIILTEGKNRQIRRMVEAVGYSVVSLRRTAVGPLALGGLAAGESRELTPSELSALKGAVSRARPDETRAKRASPNYRYRKVNDQGIAPRGGIKSKQVKAPFRSKRKKTGGGNRKPGR